jgi:hypothetical protein
MMEVTYSSETLVFTRVTWRRIQEDVILYIRLILLASRLFYGNIQPDYLLHVPIDSWWFKVYREVAAEVQGLF